MLSVELILLGVVSACAIAIFRSATSNMWRKLAIVLVFVTGCLALSGVLLAHRFARDTRRYYEQAIRSDRHPDFDDGALATQDVALHYVPVLFLSSGVLAAAAIARGASKSNQSLERTAGRSG